MREPSRSWLELTRTSTSPGSTSCPRLGTKAKEKTWWGQFVGKGQDNFKFKVKKDGGDADAITAATITSRAVTNQTDLGLTALAAHLEKR